MIKVVLVAAAVIGIGACATWFLAPYIAPYIGGISSNIPQVTDTFSTVETEVVPFVKDNFSLISGTLGGIGATATISNFLHKKGVANIETDYTQQLSTIQGYATEQANKVTQLQSQLGTAQSTIDTLKADAQSVSDLTTQLKDKNKEIEDLQSQLKAFEHMVPTIEKVEKKIEDLERVP